MRTRIQKPCVQPPHARVQAPKSSACAPARELVRAARLLLSAPQTSPTCATSRVVKLLRAPLFACLAWQQCTWKPHLELLGREAHQGYDDILLLLSSSRTTHTHPRPARVCRLPPAAHRRGAGSCDACPAPQLGMQKVMINMTGPAVILRKPLLRSLREQSSLRIMKLRLADSVPHGGCRPRKARRRRYKTKAKR